MIVGVWNVRGLCSSQKQKNVNYWVNKHSLDMFCILETKLYHSENTEKCISIFRNKGFNHFFDNLCVGRLLLFWKGHIKATIMDTFDQGILCHVDNGIYRFFVCFVYGRNNSEQRRLLWRQLALWSEWCKDGCLAILGDFNEILQCGDRSSSYIIPASARDFQTCINNMGVQEINTLGPHYT